MCRLLVVAVVVLLVTVGVTRANDYYGTFIGDFKPRFHGVAGEVYAVDSRTIFVKGFRLVSCSCCHCLVDFL